MSESLPFCKTDEDLVGLQEITALVYAGEQRGLAKELSHTDALPSCSRYCKPPLGDVMDVGADEKAQTTAALEAFFHAMTISPDAQRKAQEELDSVVGSNRLPNYDDWNSLPYIEALVREVLRWKPIAPLGVAHAITDDDMFKGFLIPKGASRRAKTLHLNLSIMCSKVPS